MLWAMTRGARPKSKPRVSAIGYLCLSTSCSWWRLRTRSLSCMVQARPRVWHVAAAPEHLAAVHQGCERRHHQPPPSNAPLRGPRRRTRCYHRRVERHVIPSEKHGGASYAPERAQGAAYATSSRRIASVVIPMRLGASGSWRCATRSRLLGLMEAVAPPQRSPGSLIDGSVPG